MTISLEFTEEHLCELWSQHTELEDYPRDVNRDLCVGFVEEGDLRQELTVAGSEFEMTDAKQGARALFGWTRPAVEAAWSHWKRVA